MIFGDISRKFCLDSPFKFTLFQELAWIFSPNHSINMKTTLFALLMLTLVACNQVVINQRPYIEKSRTANISDFEEVIISDATTAQIAMGGFSMTITGDSTDLADLQLTTINNKFSYHFSKQEKQRFGLKFKIQMPILKSVIVAGASKVMLAQFNNQQITANVSGASDLDAFGISSKKAIIDVSGASTAKISVTDNLEAIVSGASQLIYRGSPALKANVSIESTIRKD